MRLLKFLLLFPAIYAVCSMYYSLLVFVIYGVDNMNLWMVIVGTLSLLYCSFFGKIIRGK